MKKLTAIMLSALMLTAFVPLQGHAENITENIEVIEENSSTILRAGNLEYSVNEAGYAVPENVVDKSVTSIYLPAEVNGYPVDFILPFNGDYDDAIHEVFSACSDLTEITVDPDNAYLKSTDGVLFDKNGQSLLAYPPAKEGDYVIPDGTCSVERKAFWRTSRLGTVTVPESLTQVESAFAYSSVTAFIGAMPMASASSLSHCDSLTFVTFRPAVSSSGLFLLRDLPSLESVSFTPEVMINQTIDIRNCPKLKTLELPMTNPTNWYGYIQVSNCDALEKISFYNSTLSSGPPNKTPTITHCPSLREITVKQVPYVYAINALALDHLPALEHITVEELPKSAMNGTGTAAYSFSSFFTVGENCGDFTVSGHLANTNLRRWCEENGIPFESLDKRGDANLDGKVSVVDAVMLQRWLLGAAGVSCGENIDLNADGSVDIFDLALLKRMIMER